VVHFSAFFMGKWGNAKAYRETFQGYFHRLRMLGTCKDHDWLFLCDAYGEFGNGTYYTGRKGNLFVERAILAIVGSEIERSGLHPGQVVTMGSSMGATGALVVGLHFDVCGIVAIVPHVDLDVAATQCGRYEEVAFACADGDPTSEESRAVTRRVRTLLASYSPDRPPPYLFVQDFEDDQGVYREQVIPLRKAWEDSGGRVALDIRPHGGHTSDYATRPVLLEVADNMLDERPIDVTRLQSDPVFAGKPTPIPRRIRVRNWLGSLKRRVLRDAS